MAGNPALFEKLEVLQNLLISFATGGSVDEDEFIQVRNELLSDPDIRGRLPRFVRTHSDFKQLWPHFRLMSETYQGRREYIWKEFGPLLAEYDAEEAPGDARVAEALAILSSASVHTAWQTALERRVSDPDGAITSARTLLETVCKHLLDAMSVPYDSSADLPSFIDSPLRHLSSLQASRRSRFLGRFLVAVLLLLKALVRCVTNSAMRTEKEKPMCIRSRGMLNLPSISRVQQRPSSWNPGNNSMGTGLTRPLHRTAGAADEGH